MFRNERTSYKSEWRRKRKAECAAKGLCYYCKKAHGIIGQTTCLECSRKNHKRFGFRTEEAKHFGDCIRCGVHHGEKGRAYCADCRKYRTERFKQIRAKRPGHYEKINRAWYVRIGYRKHNERCRSQRLKAIELLGGKCIQCGFSDWRALQFDHLNGGGTRDKMAIGTRLKDIQKYGTSKYQLLCANCNWIKKYERDEVVRVHK